MAGKNGKKKISNGAGIAKKPNGTNENGTASNHNGGQLQMNESPKKATVTKVTTKTIYGTNGNDSDSTIHLSDISFYTAVTVLLLYFVTCAYVIRLQAIYEYGPVIHEFDPYFNYRATEYLYYNGWEKFVTWFDYQSWYPLGRPVGTTIYPGMQVTAVFIKNYIIGNGPGSMSLNDVCCYIPAWFGVIASVLTGMIAYECSLECNTNETIVGIIWSIIRHFVKVFGNEKSDSGDDKKKKKKKAETNKESEDATQKWRIAVLCGVFATGIMAIVPAHMMRSVGGGYDNESIAISAMMLTFYFWVRSLRSEDGYSFLYGILTGIAYFYMVATWGGYVFVLNMIGLHAAILVVLGRFTTKIYLSFSIFYTLGTALAIQVPVVGLTPLKSLEQLGCLAIFVGYQMLFISEQVIRKRKLSKVNAWKFRFRMFTITALIALVVITFFLPSSYFGPISSRVRGLFVKHTKTGNPLVDSVAEHQPAQKNAYYQYLHQLCTFGPMGFMIVLGYFGDSPCFLSAFAMTAYFFSLKMVRLVLLMGPIASILGGIAAARILFWSLGQLAASANENNEVTFDSSQTAKKKKAKKGKAATTADDDESIFNDFKIDNPIWSGHIGIWTKRIIAFFFLLTLYFAGGAFRSYSWSISTHLSTPSIIQKGRVKDGSVVKIDDYREAYWWIRDNTPKDARVMAWWDYGYQITAIANRTTIADGNTWNHEHIALLAKIFTTEVDEAYSIARHLADYILVWAGGGGDDLAKSPHLARIANSVYRDFCPGDPVCSSFGLVPVTPGKEGLAVRRGVMPSPKMSASLVHHLVRHGTGEIKVDRDKFREVFRSKFGKVRVYKIMGKDEESKAWAADPKNRVCDAPDSWFCPGQYPPALQEVLNKGKAFVQLEDFNKKEEDSEYQKLYMENLEKQRQKKEKAYQERNGKVKRQMKVKKNEL